MLTQDELNRDYVDCPAAAKMLNITSSQVRFLCARGRIEGAMKVGTSGWLIPRKNVHKYKPGKRGPKPKDKEDKDFLTEAINEATNLNEGANNDKQ